MSAPTPGRSASPATDLHARLLDELGRGICGGGVLTGSTVSIDDLVSRYGMSRSVVREVLRVLSSKGLVESKRGVGTVTLPPARWNSFDPQVVRWRLATGERMAQLRSLIELRSGFEPEAAALAAERASSEAVGELVTLAALMWAADERDDRWEFLRLDIQFHARLLEASGNEMFAQLGGLVTEILTGRTQQGLTPPHPDRQALENHAEVARAIQRRQPEAARAASRAIVTRSLAETRHLFEGVSGGR